MKRQRGRGRKPGSNNNRNFESNGPDVKIRGNAAHVYDKYMQLARDATSSGDRVMAENYYQHAEHYLRIVQANQPKREDADAEDGRRPSRRQDQAERGQDGAGAESTDAAQGEGEARSRSRRSRGRRRDEDTAQPAAGDDPLQVVTPDAGDDAPAAQAEAGEGEGEADAPRRGRGRRRRAEASEEGDVEVEAKPRRRTRRAPDADAEAALKAADDDGAASQSEDDAAA